MHVMPNPQSISEYAESHAAGRIRVNTSYQRGKGLWSTSAKSALIETLVLGYPVPAFYLHEKFDPGTRKPIREIVDGQQRTEAIVEFVAGKLKLSRTVAEERLRGRRIEELEDEHYEAFMSYKLPLFSLQAADDGDVREAFRRINSYQASLNAAERRHAKYQGSLKWFVHRISKELQEQLLALGVFTAKDVNRMKDTDLVSEVLYAFEKGLTTTKSQQLDSFYSAFDDEEDEFPRQDELAKRFVAAFDQIGRWEHPPGRNLTKPYQFLILVLSVMHAQRAIPSLADVAKGGRGISDAAEDALARLDDALERSDEVEAAGEAVGQMDEDEGNEGDLEDVDLEMAEFYEFVQASRRGGTNTSGSRKTRFQVIYEAVTGG